eukprot:CAMPEP_0185835866 /NCGR_PEP_ID=MMETSP1353-20130828/8638_1 /TAXON_ID=1077150 /ORGANISM="Erythrolobus australicus, Strain CCMP3124" /LENGTH=430 /DNA_ID=CAMNT_0028534575 /DNA_START=3 /DNA_END=1295 /DNA_ORIENTATION=-
MEMEGGESAAASGAGAMQANGGALRRQRVVMTVRGKDEPGITAALVRTVAEAGAEVIDVKQTLVNRHLTLGMEMSVGVEPHDQQIFRALLLQAKVLGVRVEFELSDRGHETPSMLSTKKHPSYVLTLLSESSISADFIGKLAQTLEMYSVRVDALSRLSESTLRTIEMNVSAEFALSSEAERSFRTALYSFGKEHSVDVAVQKESILRRAKRLVVMDMDSTMIQQEVIDELARYAGVYEQVEAITHRAMGGSMDFNESLRQRVSMLRGSPASTFDQVIKNLVYTEGVKDLCRALKRLGYKLAVISGGFTAITNHVKQELKLDYAFANTLEVGEDGIFTGRTQGPIVNAQRKADLLQTIAQQEQISTDQVIAIGDGANDLPMLGTAGLGIAFNAKPAVQAAASFRINQRRIDSVLYLLGFSEAELRSLTRL